MHNNFSCNNNRFDLIHFSSVCVIATYMRARIAIIILVDMRTLWKKERLTKKSRSIRKKRRNCRSEFNLTS